ncbi:MAG: 50S ribosomal protein L15 [Alphaproteobacteria bacterium]|nr:50S ribosomal protein L15 [Alphaproteobacteria bacterium]
MKLNELRDNPGAVQVRKRIGRGIGSGKGKTGGRGGKGQTARSGVSVLSFEGGQMPLYRRLPKRGFNNPFRDRLVEVNLGMVQKAIDAGRLKIGGVVDGKAMIAAGLIRRERDGIKLLAKGTIKTKVRFAVRAASKSAIEAVTKAGGDVALPAPKPETPTRGRALKRQQAAEVAAAKAAEKAAEKAAKGEGKGESKAKTKSADKA